MFYFYKNKFFTITFLLLVFSELLSFLGYYHPIINSLAFFLVIISTIFFSLRRLEYGLYVLLAELFIGSFGYLFYFESGGIKISLRLALWLVIMSVWLAKFAGDWLRTKKFPLVWKKNSYAFYCLALAIFVCWSLINGFLQANLPGNIFFDFNNWLYFLLILPLLYPIKNDGDLPAMAPVFLAAIAWLSAKTIILAYVFSHNFGGLAIDLYYWVRQSGVGEITQIVAGYNRIFMQSQIFILIGLFILLIYLLKNIKERPAELKNNQLIILATLCLTALIISFSRSFWIGLAAGGLTVWSLALGKLRTNLKQFFIFNALALFCLLLSFIMILAVIKFPWPEPYGGFNPADLLSQRATQLTGEAGASSRWQLLPELWQKIMAAPLLGKGFGATVTYKTNDPRILAQSPDGLYTTYAFEWGWLDIWLKLGMFGLIAYLALLIKIIKDGLKINSFFSLSIITGLIVLMAVNIFSPYVNHPLGIGYIIVAMAMMEKSRISN
ncbi:MAG: O-antigen ligase family protein [Patescibacteria group bacterium]|nr:O-antigen ligase family protein [Patescibacteria group bacterium]